MFNFFPIGCDSTSSFYGKGKKTAWDTFLRNREYFNSFRSLVNAFLPSEELFLKVNQPRPKGFLGDDAQSRRRREEDPGEIGRRLQSDWSTFKSSVIG